MPTFPVEVTILYQCSPGGLMRSLYTPRFGGSDCSLDHLATRFLSSRSVRSLNILTPLIRFLFGSQSRVFPEVRQVKLRLSLIVCVILASACSGATDPPSSLSGVWHAQSAGLMYNLSINIGSGWSGYRTSCSPLNAPSCLSSGAVGSASLSGSQATINLLPTSPCGNYNAQITGTATGNRIDGTIVYSSCNNPNFSSAPITLTR